jgi:hypothetical protein
VAASSGEQRGLSPLLTGQTRRLRFRERPGSQPAPACAGAKAESAARERLRPVEPAPGNAGEGTSLHPPSPNQVHPNRKAEDDRESNRI